MDAEKILLDNGYDDVSYLVNYSYDSALIGVSTDNRAIYDYNLMIKWLVDTEGFDEIDAIEWININTIRALPYLGENPPIIMNSLEREV